MKKSVQILIIIFFCFSLCSMFFLFQTKSSAKTFALSDVEEEYTQEIESQLSDLNFEEVEKIIDSLNDDQKEVFGNQSFLEKVYLLLKGDFSTDFSSFSGMLLSILFKHLLSFLPLIAAIIGVSILGGMVGNLNPNSSGKSLESIVHFVIYGVITIMISSIVVRMISLTTTTLYSIKGQTEVIFPILLTLLTAIGGSSSVGVYGSAISILSTFMIGIFTSFILPLFLISIALNFVSNLSNSIKLDKLVSFINSLFKWVIGISFTIFTGFVSIQGIAAGAIDGLSIKTAKFTIKNSLPMVGSYISDGLYLILASSSLIKSIVGGAGLILLLATILSPLVELILFSLSLKFIAGVIEPLGDKKIAGFVSTLSKSMGMLIVMLVSVSFMYVVITGLVMSSVSAI